MNTTDWIGFIGNHFINCLLLNLTNKIKGQYIVSLLNVLGAGACFASILLDYLPL
jgi:hypothetical protein